MSGINDFLQRFTGQAGLPNPNEALHLFDRFTSNQPQDQEFDTQQMHAAAADHMQQMPESDFHQAAQNAFANATPQQQQGLIGSLMRAVQSHGVNLGSIMGMFGGAIPSQMNASQFAQIANVVRQQHPQAMQDVVREQPWYVKAMGNPVVMGALGVVASRMIRHRMGPPSQARAGM